MNEHGIFYNTDSEKQKIIFDNTGVNAMERQSTKDPAGGYNNPIEVTDRNEIYYHTGTDKVKSEISVDSSYYNNRDAEARFCCVKSRLTAMERCLIKTVILFLALILCSYVVFFWYLSYGETSIWIATTSSTKVACHSPTCIQTAGEILQSMNREVKPCDNFFEFACGGWQKSNPIPEDKERWDTFAVAYEQIHHRMKESLERDPTPDEPWSVTQLRTGYKACLNQTAWNILGSEPLIELLEEFGGLPMITPNWDVGSFNFIKSLAKLIREYNEKFLIGIYIIPDLKNSSQFAIHMEEGILPVSKYLFSDGDNAEKKNQMERMTTVAMILLETSLEKLRAKQKPQHEQMKGNSTVPFFIIPANHSYIITKTEGNLDMQTTGQTYQTIWSNDTELFNNPIKHFNKKMKHSNAEEISPRPSYLTPAESHETAGNHSSKEYKLIQSEEDTKAARTKRSTVDRETLSNLVSYENYWQDKSSWGTEDPSLWQPSSYQSQNLANQVPLIIIPANHSYVITQRIGDVVIESVGQTYVPLLSDNSEMFRNSRRYKRTFFSPDVQQIIPNGSPEVTDKLSLSGNTMEPFFPNGINIANNLFPGLVDNRIGNVFNGGRYDRTLNKFDMQFSQLPSENDPTQSNGMSLPFFTIPANQAHVITKRFKGTTTETFGETYEPLDSNNEQLFQYYRKYYSNSYISDNSPSHYLPEDISSRLTPSLVGLTPHLKRSAELFSNLKGKSVPKLQPHNEYQNPKQSPISPEEVEGAFSKQKVIMKNDIEDLWKFYGNLAEIMQPEFSSRAEDMYNPMTVKELNKFNGRFNIIWKDFLSDVMSKAHIAIDDDTVINIPHESYFEKLFPFLMQTHPRVIANAILFQLILNMGAEVAPYREPTQDFLGRYDERPWFDCAQKMNSLMDLAATRLYIDGSKTEHTDDINKVTDLVKDLKHALFSGINDKPWMDKRTKEVALKKVNHLNPIVGFPSKYLINQKLDAVYKNLPELSSTDHFGNIKKLLKFTSLKSLSRYNKTPSRQDFLSSPLDVNAFYSIQRNNIQIPMGILMSPFYRRDATKAFIYGATGSIISHELSHGFDVKGRKWDQYGNLYPWWGHHTLKTYMKKALCYVDKYKSLPLTNELTDQDGKQLEINTKRTLTENIADSEGLHLAWKAYIANKDEPPSSMIGLEGYSPEQIFFIGYAQMWCSNYSPTGLKRSLQMDVHSPHPSRVNGAVRNHPEFADIFNCPNNSTMFSDEFCNIW